MRHFRHIIFFILFAIILSSCDSKLDVTAEWKDITVVYGLLDQNDSVHYLKITKAFLGEGNALMFAKIADSSNYPELDVKIEEWIMNRDKNGKIYDSQYVKTISFDTATITNKEKGDSIFYYPSQLVYKSGFARLNQENTYKLFIKENRSGKEIRGYTQLVGKLGEITKPAGNTASFKPGTNNKVEWVSAARGKRYQFVARFHYYEFQDNSGDTAYKSVDWIILDDIKTDTTRGITYTRSYSADAFYTVIGNRIHENIREEKLDSNYSRRAVAMEYIFTIAADDLNTYMEVTEPSYTIVQEKPPFTNIINGIGIFSSRHDNTKDRPVIQTRFSDETYAELVINEKTKDLGFDK